MSSRRRWIIQGLLVTTLLLGAGLRFVGLERVPPGLCPDEATNGYDAYSIAMTGRDQHGALLPTTTASLNDYRMPAFIYLTVPFVAAMGLSVTSVRLAAAMVGWLALPVTYHLGRRMLGQVAGAAAMVFLALSPWHLPFSRLGLEGSTVALFAVGSVAGIWQWHSDNHRWRWVGFTGILLGLSLYTYSIMKLFVPLLIGGFALVFWRDIQANSQQVVALIVVVLILAIPMIRDTIDTPQFMQARYDQITVLKPGRPIDEALGEVLANATLHISPRFLFSRGDLDRLQHPPGAGQLYWIQLPLILTGSIVGLWRTQTRKVVLLLLVWIGAAIVPVSLTRMNVASSGHSLRSIPMVVAWQVLSGAGLTLAIRWRPRWRIALAAIAAVVMLGQAIPYLHTYFVEYPDTVLARFDDGMREVVQAMDALDDNYETVVFTDQASWPYLHILFFSRYDPHKLQADLPEREPQLFAPVTRLGKYYIGDVKAAYKTQEHGLFIMPASMLPEVEPMVVTTYNSNGRDAFKIVAK